MGSKNKVKNKTQKMNEEHTHKTYSLYLLTKSLLRTRSFIILASSIYQNLGGLSFSKEPLNLKALSPALLFENTSASSMRGQLIVVLLVLVTRCNGVTKSSSSTSTTSCGELDQATDATYVFKPSLAKEPELSGEISMAQSSITTSEP